MIVSAEGENCAVYSYKEDKIIKEIPEFKFTKQVDPGTLISSGDFAFTILLNEQFNPKANVNKYKFRFNTKDELLKSYHRELSVVLPDKFTTIMDISIRDKNRQKAIDFLNKLTEIYTLDNLGKKNENANRTIQFIDSQLQNISDSLNISENRKERFQSAN